MPFPRWLGGIAVLALLAGVASAADDGLLPDGVDTARDGLLCLVGAGLVVARAILVPADRRVFGAFGVGILGAGVGTALWPLAGNGPSLVSDGPFLIGYLFYWLGLWRLLRRRVGGASSMFWLDALGSMLWLAAAAGLALAVAYDARGGRAALDGFYPAADLAMASVPFVVAAQSGRRMGPQDRLLAAALLATFVGDSLVALQDAHALTVSTGWMQVFWEAQILTFGVAAWARPAPPGMLRIGGWWEWAPTVTWIVAGGGMLLAGAWLDLPDITVGLAIATLAAACLRSGMAIHRVGGMVIQRDDVLTDHLTGLPNRHALFAELDLLDEDGGRSGEEATLLVLGLDGFRELNDTLGHRSGDALLREVSDRLKPLVRPARLVRLGGDEFAALLRPPADVAAVAEALREALTAPLDLGAVAVTVQASIGLARFPHDAVEAGELARRADVAMTDAKRRRVGVAHYAAERDANSVSRLALAADLRRALDGEADDLGLWLAFQPQIDLPTGRCSATEALIRWTHPDRGPITPDELLPIAERGGLMPALTDWVFDRALREVAALHEAGHPLRVAVNVSAATLVDVALPDRIQAALRRHGVAPEHLVVEVTEDAVMSDQRRCLDVLERIAALDVHVSIDDFGTGHSSLAQLRHLPAVELKIDRSFVLRMAEDPLDAEVVRLVVTMGSRMGLRVVAEGVETDEQRRALTRLGCHVGQGFGLGRPMPAQELRARLRADGSVALAA